VTPPSGPIMVETPAGFAEDASGVGLVIDAGAVVGLHF
jgi:hypothetical protein